jgi:hypothetical protein
LENGQIRRTGKYLVNPYHVGENGDQSEGIEGEEDAILNPEFLGAPFGVSHNKGSVYKNIETLIILILNMICN